MTTLQEATTAVGGTLTADASWLQGRGVYGGLTIAALVRAIEERVADPRRVVRSVTAEIPAPTLPGVAARVEVDVLRSGNNLTVGRASLRQGDEVTTHVVAVLAAPRDLGVHLDVTTWEPPALPPWQPLPVAPAGPPAPPFGQHFEYRVVSGMPFSGGEPVATGWVRARAPGQARDAAYIAALVDVWFPGMLVKTREPRAFATITYTLDIVDGLAGLPPDDPLGYRGTVTTSRDGYFLERRELWGSDGRLVALNHQTFAILK